MKNRVLSACMILLMSLAAMTASAVCNSTVNYQQATICEGHPYNFYGTQLGTAGTYNDTIVLSGGCDSIISLQLFVIPTVYNNLYDTICQGGSYSFYGSTLTQAGTYGDTLFTGAQFCDSIILLHLAVRSAHNDTIPQHVTYCATGGGPGQGYNFYGTTLNQSGTYYHTITGAAICQDTVIQLFLIVGRTNPGPPQTVSICQGQSYDFNGHILTTAGTYADTLVSSLGCDSIIRINLTVGTYYRPAAQVATFCVGTSYTWHGHTYTTGSPGGPNGGYRDTVHSATGCDTIFTLQLTAVAGARATVRDSFCYGSSFQYGGNTYTTAGRDTFFTPMPTGCDSMTILILTYKAAPTVLITDSFCRGSVYQYGTDTFMTAGNHNVGTRPAATGCDTVITLRLTYIAAPRAQIVDSFCQGTAYYYGADSFTTQGPHQVTVPAPTGCDSVITLLLRYKAASAAPTITQQGSTLIANPAAATYQWYLDGQAIAGANSQLLTVTQNGVYAVAISGGTSCPARSANDTVTTIGITAIEASNIRLYPNPNNGTFTIERSGNTQAELTVYDVYGRVSYQAVLGADRQVIDMSAVAAGTYYVAIRDQQRSSYIPLVISR